MVQLLTPLLNLLPLQTLFTTNMTLLTYTQALRSSLSKAGLGLGSTLLLPEDFTPSTELVISYGDKPVELGNTLKTSETREAPSVRFSGEQNEASTYTLMLVDPDAPTPEDPTYAYWRHWILTSLCPSSSESSIPLYHVPITTYIGPGAKDDTATPHRYLFLLYREPYDFHIQKADIGGEAPMDRRSFNAVQFVDRNDLELVSVNWFMGVGDWI